MKYRVIEKIFLLVSKMKFLPNSDTSNSTIGKKFGMGSIIYSEAQTLT